MSLPKMSTVVLNSEGFFRSRSAHVAHTPF